MENLTPQQLGEMGKQRLQDGFQDSGLLKFPYRPPVSTISLFRFFFNKVIANNFVGLGFEQTVNS